METYAPATLADVNANNLVSLGVTAFDILTVPNYVGTVVTTTDASGRKGRAITNALGQLTRVDEPTGAGGTADTDLGTLAAPNQPTFYTYSPQGKMVKVTQGVQSRYFLYDSLGRLIRVRQPEQEVNTSLNLADPVTGNSQWTAGFTYDILGNVIRATDANGVNIISEYDRANRVTKRCYTKPNISTTATACAQIPSGSVSTDTPEVNFYYDGKGLAQTQSPNYAKGKLTKVTSSVSETQYSLFDNLGRLTESKQITDGQTYTSSYQYNLSGALVQETYSSGRVVRNEFEPDGDLSRIYGQANIGTMEKTYANSFSYAASGGISQMKLGNGKWETAKFNTRLQVTELGLGNSSADASVWKVGYEYGELDTNGDVVTSKNTGNIARQTLTIPGTSFVQNYRYDSLYRLTEAKETTGATQNWIQNWNYDRYGNRAAFTQNIGGLTNAPNPVIDPNTNRFTDLQTFGYDKNGNITKDVAPNNQSRTFVFNGDNKQSEVKDANGIPIGKYFYDGEGKRVKKVTDTETTVFVYSSGKLVAEYSTQLSQTPSISYTTTDHLGSPRVITDQSGQVTSRRDFMPFGEDLYSGIGARNEVLKYSLTSDGIRQKFTGYQKDSETSLDFAEARMYDNRYARFTAVDSLIASGKSANPQTFNRFLYVGNNPLFRVDRGGKIWGRADDGRVRWFKGNLGNGFSEFRPKDWTYSSKNGRLVQLNANNAGWKYVDSSTAKIVGPHPLYDPQGYINDQTSKVLKAAELQVREAVYNVSPDYVKFQWSVPMLFSVEGAMSKDLRFYFGGGVGRGGFSDFLKQAGNFNFIDPAKPNSLGFKPIPSFSAGYFLNGVDSERTRDNAMTGTNVSGIVPLSALGIPASVGLSKSIPDNGAPFLTSPTAVEIGTPNAGAGVSQSGEVLTDFSDFLRRRFDREPIPR